MKVTGGDLYHLWRVSEVHLPRIADVFYDAYRLVAGAAAGNDEGGFRANAEAYPGSVAMTSTVGLAWAHLRDELQTMFAQIGSTVLAGAQGIRDATKAITDSDAGNADLLAKYIADPINLNKSDGASNPPAPGADDNPGQPVLPQ